jgi:uncharacterized coiled-coil protein SlyX
VQQESTCGVPEAVQRWVLGVVNHEMGHTRVWLQQTDATLKHTVGLLHDLQANADQMQGVDEERLKTLEKRVAEAAIHFGGWHQGNSKRLQNLEERLAKLEEDVETIDDTVGKHNSRIESIRNQKVPGIERDLDSVKTTQGKQMQFINSHATSIIRLLHILVRMGSVDAQDILNALEGKDGG